MCAVLVCGGEVGGGGGIEFVGVGVCGCRCGKKYVGLFLTWQPSTQPILAGFSPNYSLGPKPQNAQSKLNS